MPLKKATTIVEDAGCYCYLTTKFFSMGYAYKIADGGAVSFITCTVNKRVDIFTWKTGVVQGVKRSVTLNLGIITGLRPRAFEKGNDHSCRCWTLPLSYHKVFQYGLRI